MLLLNLKQINTITNHNGSLLDRVYTNIEIINVNKHVPFVREDSYHPALYLSMNLALQGKFKNDRSINAENLKCKRGWFFDTNKWNILDDMLSRANWNELYDCDDPNVAVECFYRILYDIFDCCFVPVKRRLNRKLYPIWFSSNIKQMLKTKYFNHKNWKRTKSDGDYVIFCSLRKKIKADIKKAYKAYMGNIERNIINDPKHFWSFVNYSCSTWCKYEFE